MASTLRPGTSRPPNSLIGSQDESYSNTYMTYATMYVYTKHLGIFVGATQTATTGGFSFKDLQQPDPKSDLCFGQTDLGPFFAIPMIYFEGQQF